ncbi:transporter substrate-binding domain-containing protein [Aestuariibacter halophilus]|uniref:Transporter substrate-binding domain-containing protein n=1 Tax=Fluctibacter halophilus TaxID=226011 RepID=A0ABS8G8A5_9ALTE|nr:transporter substrate-binding domain-containing protein [Aestuariibacter halophilus]MCC2616807.1 transporter substrate-binding domain-containing protein [Aestuariibacter halophilus]
MRHSLLCLVGLMLIGMSAAHAAKWNIHYPRPLTDNDQRNQYPIALLEVALQQTGVRYSLMPSERIMLQNKALKQLSENREVNIVWSMTDQSREDSLLPIRIPIYKGLIGWRIFLIRQQQAHRYVGMEKIEQLMQLRPIQGHDWPDTKILQSNGFDVSTAKEYLDLFTMLDQGKGDFVPRSVVEIWAELDGERMPDGIVLEPELGIRYPSAMYYFVNKRNTTMGRLIRDGLEKAIANGEFDRLFLQYHQDIIDKSRLNERQFYQLENPLLPPETPLSREELWYRPSS